MQLLLFLIHYYITTFSDGPQHLVSDDSGISGTDVLLTLRGKNKSSEGQISAATLCEAAWLCLFAGLQTGLRR